MHGVRLLTWFCKLLTTVAILSGGHVPQVPQWHDDSYHGIFYHNVGELSPLALVSARPALFNLVTANAPLVFCPFQLRSVTDEQHVRIV